MGGLVLGLAWSWRRPGQGAEVGDRADTRGPPGSDCKKGEERSEIWAGVKPTARSKRRKGEGGSAGWSWAGERSERAVPDRERERE